MAETTVESTHLEANDRSIPDAFSPTDIFIPVMGVTGAGKSTFISLCTNEEVMIGHTLLSCTFSPRVYSLQRRGHIVRLIDTPGFDDSKRPDIDILTDLAYYLTSAYNTKPKILLSGIIYLHPINEPRLQGTAKKNLKMFKLLCGEKSLHSVVLATTMWRKEIEVDSAKRVKQLETTPDFWGNMIRHGSTIFQHDNTPDSALRIIDHIIEKRKRIVLSIQEEMVDEHKQIDETSAGQLQREEIIKEKQKAARRLQENQKEIDERLREKKEASVQELLKEQEKDTDQLKQKEEEIEALKLSVEQLQKQKEAQMRREEDELQKFMEQQDAKVDEMTRELEELQASHERDLALVHEKQSLGEHRGAGEDDRVIIERLMNKIQETDNNIQRVSEQIQEVNMEKKTLKALDKKRFAKRSMQYGGVGAAFGGVAAGTAGAALLCSVM